MTLRLTPGAEVALRSRLGEMPECWLEVRCAPCGSLTIFSMKLLAARHGSGMPIGGILGRLLCQRCRSPPAEAWLNETHNRQHQGGTAPGWSVQLVSQAAL